MKINTPYWMPAVLVLLRAAGISLLGACGTNRGEPIKLAPAGEPCDRCEGPGITRWDSRDCKSQPARCVTDGAGTCVWEDQCSTVDASGSGAGWTGSTGGSEAGAGGSPMGTGGQDMGQRGGDPAGLGGQESGQGGAGPDGWGGPQSGQGGSAENVGDGGAWATYGQAFQQSLSNWERLRAQHGDSYQYINEQLSWVGFYATQTVTVVAGVVVRVDAGGGPSGPDGVDGGTVTSEWSLEGAEITADGGKAPPTVDELYATCQNDVLTKDPADNYLYFQVDADGVLGMCGYAPRSCADDCYQGVDITVTFE